MWNPPINNSGHSPLSTAEPKWVPYLRANNLLSDIPPEGTTSNVMIKNPNIVPVVPASHESPNNSDGDQPVIRRIASAPLQYQECIPREHSSHLHSKSPTKNRTKTNSTKNQNPPKLKATVSTISWREELTHFRSSHPQSPHRSKPASKTSSYKSEENHAAKNSTVGAIYKEDGKVLKSNASKGLTSVEVNGKNEPKSASSIDAILSSLKTLGTNGHHYSNSTKPPVQSKTELKSQEGDAEDGHYNNLTQSISTVKKLEKITRSHIDVTDHGSKDGILQSKKRCSSENNLTTAQKNDEKHKLSGKTRLVSSKADPVRRPSSKKADPAFQKKTVTEVQEPVTEKTKSYDPEKAREYIKQQRCERLTSIREEKERKKAYEEAKKQKLSELDHKRHLLLQANIKKKPHQAGEGKVVCEPKTEDLKAPSTVLVPKLNSIPSSSSVRRPATVSSAESGLYVFPGPPHPVVADPVKRPSSHAPSDSSAVIIKDINDMKATIEILANSIKNALHSGKSEHAIKERSKAPTVVTLQDGVELKIGEKIQEEVKVQPKPLSFEKPLLIQESCDAVEVNHLTNNLRKLRENFRTVLAQNLNVRAKPRSETKPKSLDSSRAEEERLQQWLQKIKITRTLQSGSSSDVDRVAANDHHRRPKRRRTKSNTVHNSYQRTRSLARRRETSDDSDQENLSGGPLHHVQSSPKSESNTGIIPEWLKPLQEPYPVNFMSVVKRKMASKNTQLEAPASTSTCNTISNAPQSQPIVGHTFSSSNQQNPVFLPATVPPQDIFNSEFVSDRRRDSKGTRGLVPPTDGLFSTQTTRLFDLFSPKPNCVEKSQQTTPKDSLAVSSSQEFQDESERQTADNSSGSGLIINTFVPPLPRLSSTTTEVSSRIASPEVLSTGTSTRVSQVSVIKEVKPATGFVEDEEEPLYESDFEQAPLPETRNSGDDTDAPSISSTVGENLAVDTESIRLVTPNVDLFSNKTEKSDWSSRRDCGDGEHASQEASNLTGKDSFEIGKLFNPEAIHLQFQAELNRLDAFNESLYHVMEVEKVRAVALAREQALSSTKAQTTSEQPSSKIDKSVSVQKSLPVTSADISTVNYTRGAAASSSAEISTVNYTRGAETLPSLSKLENNADVARDTSTADTIKTEMAEDQISPESPSSSVGTCQPSSIPEKSISPQSSDATISEDILSQKPPQETVRTHLSNEKKQPKRLKLRQVGDKLPSETLSKGNKVVSVESESREASVVLPGQTTDTTRTADRRPAIPTNSEDAFKFTFQMLEQLMYEEELRVQHKRTLLKLRERVLCDMAKAECASLDVDKKKLRDIGGQEEQISALRKKQRGVLMKFQQQREEINSMQRTDELVWKERRLMYLRQLHLFRMQMATRVPKNRRVEEGSVMPKSVMSSRGIASRRDLDPDVTPDFNALLATASLSSPSAASDISIPSISIPANTSGDTESSCVDDRPFQSIKDLDLRSRNSRDRVPLDPLRQPVERLNLWRRSLEEEDRQLRDSERQGHSRHTALHFKHSFRDRSTSPFQFSENAPNFGRGTGNSKQRSRPISNGIGSGTVGDDSSVPEDIADQQDSNLSSVQEALSAAAASEGYTESFESIESDGKTADTQSGTGDIPTQSNGSKENSVRKATSPLSDCSNGVGTKQLLFQEKAKGHSSVPIKIPLSPRLQRVQRRRYSSGSDDSIVFSQTETGSEQSDIEGRISALTEQLEQRKAEAERLRREAKRTRSERLLAKEQSLQNQLQAYDVYISQARQNLDAELKQTSVPIVRPQIKQPRVASARKAKNSNTLQQTEQDVSIQDSVAESSASQDSSLDAAILSPTKQNGAELEFVLPEHSGPKDVISDAMSTIPSEVASGDISEVSSENGSTVSNENASLVANMGGGSNEMAVKKAVVDVGSDTLSNAGSDVASEVATDVLSEMESLACTEIIEDVLNKQDDATKGESADVSRHTEESDEASSTSSPVSSDSVPLEKAYASESGDAEDLIEVVTNANVIKIVLKGKEKGEEEKQKISPVPSTEDTALSLNQDQQAALVDKITDSILVTLLNDCLQSAKTLKKKSDESIKNVIAKQVQENVLQNSSTENACQQIENKSKDVRTRVHKILADTIHSPSSRTESRMQDLLVTTYDILSPEDSPCSSPHQGSPTRQMSDSSGLNEYTDSKVQTLGKQAEVSTGKFSVQDYNSSSDPALIFNDSSQDWLDEECTGVQEKEAELLQIVQRIQQLDQAIGQTTYDQIPYLIREIPNKPPPPYTPPGQAPRVLATSVPCSPPLEEIRAVTKSPYEIVVAVTTATDILYEAHHRNQDLKTVIPPEHFLVEGYSVPEHVKLSEQDLLIHKNSARVYRRFLFDLPRQIIEEAYSHEQEEECPPWLMPENVFSKRKALAEASQSKAELQQVVSRQVLALFGLGPKAEKENLTIRWSRKKRDQVDELLVREFQEEERQWTSYEYDGAIIKNNITESILEALLIDTTEVIKEIYQRRERRSKESEN